MKFTFANNGYGNIPEDEIFEFDTLEEFAEWTNKIECPRFVLVPPHKKNTWSGVTNISDHWLIWTYPDYD
jgi:hypothetical protein